MTHVANGLVASLGSYELALAPKQQAKIDK